MKTITTERFTFKKMTIDNLEIIASLVQQINDKKSLDEIKKSLSANFDFNNYMVLGFYDDNKLVGLTSGWSTAKVYSGKQLEVDNVIVDNRLQSKGYGKMFFNLIEEWATKRGYKSIELNTYIHNYRSHKFYFNQGYIIGGYHFHKELNQV